ncbi:MAG: hypothetical protein CTY12_01420 [Methylotenera sp.]|nr:MAG: hypothetical protein CTY12_01420 [Methylotenera sp.]
MNTLLTKEQFIIFRDAFKARARAKSITAADLLIYNVIRGHEANRGFTPITNKIKLINGQAPNGGFDNARYQAKNDLVRYTSFVERFGNFAEVSIEKLDPTIRISLIDTVKLKCPIAYDIYVAVENESKKAMEVK